jgi:hypothetical protein
MGKVKSMIMELEADKGRIKTKLFQKLLWGFSLIFGTREDWNWDSNPRLNPYVDKTSQTKIIFIIGHFVIHR